MSVGAGIFASLVSFDRLRDEAEILPLADGTATTREHRAAEQATEGTATRVADSRVEPVPERFVQREADILDQQLQKQGGRLSGEPRAALELGCSDRQSVTIEGQAGTGKSTVLRAIARAHQADGRQIIVTSTGAIALSDSPPNSPTPVGAPKRKPAGHVRARRTQSSGPASSETRSSPNGSLARRRALVGDT